MNIDRLHETFLELVAIESPSFSEAAMAAHCACALEGMGFATRFDDAGEKVGSDTGNLLATRAGDAAGEIVLSAHMDTVKPCAGIEVVRTVHDEHGEIYCSAGDTILSADDKAGVAAIFEGVRSALESGRALPTIHVLLTVCEEQSLLGSSAVDGAWLAETVGAAGIAEYLVPCYVFDADGTPGTIISGAPCHMTLRAAFTGRAAHAGVEPEAGASAIEMAARAIMDMPLGRIDEATTANVGVIDGGIATNVVAPACALEGECRSLYRDRADAQRDLMSRACEQAARTTGGTADISWTLDYPEILYSEDDPFMVRTVAAIEAAGLTPRFHHTGGGSDANVLGEKGLQAVALGIGMTNFHSVDEFITVRDLEDSARLAEALIFEYAG